MRRLLFALRRRRILRSWAQGQIDYSTAHWRYERLVNEERRAA